MYRRNRQGVGLVYATIILSVLVIACSFAVDYGRVQLAKTQLQAAVDAAAKAGAGELPNGITAATNATVNFASYNLVDNQPVIIDPTTVEFGTWDRVTRQFTALTGAARANAV